jgi:hypothetical protein
MALVKERPVKVIKRTERRSSKSQLGPRECRTSAQEQRAIVSAVVSWIKERKASTAGPIRLFRLGPETQLKLEQESR